ncbi:MAG: hypothetical protein QM780_16300 [Hyphomicrobium sp.]|uniref:hypothetical protein n=1 Tax=Hyphomicrobium sp. TaxID=82 RepID=UPI0039E458FE
MSDWSFSYNDLDPMATSSSQPTAASLADAATDTASVSTDSFADQSNDAAVTAGAADIGDVQAAALHTSLAESPAASDQATASISDADYATAATSTDQPATDQAAASGEEADHTAAAQSSDTVASDPNAGIDSPDLVQADTQANAIDTTDAGAGGNGVLHEDASNADPLQPYHDLAAELQTSTDEHAVHTNDTSAPDSGVVDNTPLDQQPGSESSDGGHDALASHSATDDYMALAEQHTDHPPDPAPQSVDHAAGNADYSQLAADSSGAANDQQPLSPDEIAATTTTPDAPAGGDLAHPAVQPDDSHVVPDTTLDQPISTDHEHMGV